MSNLETHAGAGRVGNESRSALATDTEADSGTLEIM